MNNSNQNESQLSDIEKKKLLRQKLRNKIRNKASARYGKNHNQSQHHKATEALKKTMENAQGNSQIDLNSMLKNLIPDSQARKLNKKRIKKMITQANKNVEKVSNENNSNSS